MSRSTRVPDIQRDSTIVDPIGAFGSVLTDNLDPLIQMQFPYNANDRIVSSLLAGSGAVSVSGSLATISTGTTTASDVLFRSIEEAHYAPGQGIRVRFTAIFQVSGTSGTSVGEGFGNEEDGFFFGYNGTAFGVLHRFFGVLEHQTLTITTGAVTNSGNITITLDGTETIVAVTSGDSVQEVVRKIVAISFVGWDAQAFGDQVIFIDHIAQTRGADFTLDDTGTTGTVGTFSETTTGAAPTDTWIAQTSWNKDKMNGSGSSGITLALEKGNVYQIVFGWLGFDNICFFLKSKTTGKFILVHVIEYINSNTAPSIANPSLPWFAFVKNGGTTTDIILKTSSIGIFSEGKHAEGGISFSTSVVTTLPDATEKCILVLKNKPVFQGVQNRVEYIPTLLTFSANGAGAAKATTLRLVHNPVIGGPTSFTDIDSNSSTVAVDTASTTRTGGNVLGTFVFGADVENFVIRSDELREIMGKHPPGNIMAITAQIDGGTSDIQTSINLKELF